MTRVLSAVVIIAIVFSTLWFAPEWAVLMLSAALAVMCGVEYAQLARAAGHGGSSVPTAASAGILCVAIGASWFPGTKGALIDLVELAVVLLVFAIVTIVLAAGRPRPEVFRWARPVAFAPFYIGLPLGLLARLHGLAHGLQLLLWFLVVMTTSDSAQYYCGRAFGRRKLAPAISPAKTIEGAIGGLLAAGAIGAVLAPTIRVGDVLPLTVELAPAKAAAVAMLLAVAGMAGDLFESMLKRSAGVKDASSLIPGHGGVLDRLDSYLLAAPVYVVALSELTRGVGIL